MHPLISIISLIVSAIALSLSVTLYASLSTFIACLVFIFMIENGRAQWFGLLWRLRWFWISITILYVGFTAGEPVWPHAPWSPSVEGLRLGLMRLLILIDIFTLVFILHKTLSRSRILAGLYALCWPLELRQGLREKLVMRLMLTLEYVEQLPAMYKQVNSAVDPRATRFSRIVEVLQKMINKVSTIERDDRVSFQTLALPVWYEWFYPFAVALFYYTLAGI